MGIYWVLLAVFHMNIFINKGNCCIVNIKSNKDFVIFGQTVLLECTSNCMDVVWETRLTKLSTKKEDYSSSVEVLVQDWEDSPIKCVADSNNEKVTKAETRVIPYALPSKMTIDLKEELEEDKEHEVTCSAYGVAPVKYVILSVTRGGVVFLNKTYEGDTRREPHNLTETFKFMARRSDNMRDFACQVTLNLTRVTNATVDSPSVIIKTYALPENPRIRVEEWMEKGTQTYISCEVLHSFPTENITTKLSVDGFPNFSATGNTFVSIPLDTSNLTEGQYKVICVSEVYNFSKQSDQTIVIYESPNMTLMASRKVINLGYPVQIDCNLFQGNAQYFGLSLRVDGVEKKRVQFPDLVEKINATRRKPDISVTCELFIQENGKVLFTAEEALTVHYPPEFNDVSCPNSLIWVDGQERMFGCSSDGNPTPEEQCSFNNLFLQSTSYFTAERNMSGVYMCRASNSVGTVTKSVEVTVQYPPGTPTVNISKSSIGAKVSVNLSCYSDALPHPVYNWTIPPNAQVEFSQDNRSITIKKASWCHNGNYTCYATNKHGQSLAHWDLKSDIDNTMLIAIVCVCIGVFLAVILGLTTYIIHQKKKRGKYCFIKKKEDGIPMQNIKHENQNDGNLLQDKSTD
ncbi:intercellular adhesion molecule 1-like [Pyxicephalus adspersus]|uniref:intercellular adhesion molecule 1-like n=1 Tax=Pyxicephalus adspersus TaxID=30357 RepID=UPI003B59487F